MVRAISYREKYRVLCALRVEHYVILKFQVFYMVLGVILMLTGFTFLLYMWILAVIEIKNKINALNRRIKD